MTAGQWMRHEISEQPDLWRTLTTDGQPSIDAAAQLIRDTAPQLIVMVARGSSDHAAMYAQYLIHAHLGIPVALATPATATVFDTTMRYPRAVALAVSQSGQSPDLIATLEALHASGIPVVSYTNDPASPLAAAGDVSVDLAAGPEISVAATKTYTAELLALFLTISRVAGKDWSTLQTRVADLAYAATTVLYSSSDLNPAVDLLAIADRILVIGRGLSMSSAREGALKLMETNALPASGWSAADATQGPLGQVIAGTPVVALTAGPAGRDSVITFSQAAADLGAQLIEIGANALTDPPVTLSLPQVDDDLVPVLEILPLQQLALSLALHRGLDPDQPAGLKKITVTH